MKFQAKDVTIPGGKPKDSSDPGFMLKGYVLRWLSSGVEVRRGGRIWQTLKLSMLPEPAVKKLKTYYPSWVQSGDTVRKRDQVLAFAPLDEVNKLRASNKEAQDANEAILRSKRKLHHGVIQSQGSMHTERIEASEEFN